MENYEKQFVSSKKIIAQENRSSYKIVFILQEIKYYITCSGDRKSQLTKYHVSYVPQEKTMTTPCDMFIYLSIFQNKKINYLFCQTNIYVSMQKNKTFAIFKVVDYIK